MDSDQEFTKQGRCAECDGPLNQGENWGCAQAFVPIYGLMGATVHIHRHLHIRCATGHLKFLALQWLGRMMVELN